MDRYLKEYKILFKDNINVYLIFEQNKYIIGQFMMFHHRVTSKIHSVNLLFKLKLTLLYLYIEKRQYISFGKDKKAFKIT